MTKAFKVYQSGLQAFEKQNFSEAIELLEAYCQQGSNSQSLEYARACKTLVKAYQAVKEIEKAIALCQELTQSKRPQVKSWAKRWLEKLSEQQETTGSGTEDADLTNQLPTNGSQPDLEKGHCQTQPQLTPEQTNRLLIEGRNALCSKHYPQAIQALEQFRQGVDTLHPEYYQVQMWLATAYQQNHQLQAALALGQKLAAIENPTIQAWATKFLQSLSVVVATETVSQIASPQNIVNTRKENPPSNSKNTSEFSETGFQLRSLSEFKNFCRSNLKSDLQEFERKRQSALQALIVVGTIIFIVLTVATTQAPKVLSSISLYQSIIPENICQEFEQLPSEKQEEYVASISEGQLSVPEFSIGCQKSQFSFRNLSSFLVVFAIFLVLFIGCLWGWVIFYSVQTEMYERGFKSRVIEKIIDFINNNQGLNYSTYGDDYSTRMAILNSQLFPSLANTFSLNQDDCIFGNIGQSKMFFSEVDAKHEIHHGFLSDLVIFLLRRRSFLQTLSLFILVIFLTLSLLKAAPYIIGRMIRGQRFDYDEFKKEV